MFVIDEPEVVNEFASSVADCLDRIADAERLRVRCIALDAPRDYKTEGAPRRACEVAMDERNISCITTHSKHEFDNIVGKARAHLQRSGPESRIPHANQIWMLVGFALFRELERWHECLEVFPQAIVSTLGVADSHKTRKEGLDAQLKAVARRTGWADHEELRRELGRCCYGLAHDKLDAYMSAWIASLPDSERTPLGRAPDDAIWVPIVH